MYDFLLTPYVSNQSSPYVLYRYIIVAQHRKFLLKYFCYMPSMVFDKNTSYVDSAVESHAALVPSLKSTIFCFFIHSSTIDAMKW